jgi:hypothetical protein
MMTSASPGRGGGDGGDGDGGGRAQRGTGWSTIDRQIPQHWHCFALSAADIGIVAALALSGTLTEPLPWRLVLAIFVAAAAFALILDQIKQPVTAVFKVE